MAQSCEAVVCELEMLPVVPPENPPSRLWTLPCSRNPRRRDAKAAGRVELADTARSAQAWGSRSGSGGPWFRARRICGQSANFAASEATEDEDRLKPT